jgi:hypothetical protein
MAQKVEILGRKMNQGWQIGYHKKTEGEAILASPFQNLM